MRAMPLFKSLQALLTVEYVSIAMVILGVAGESVSQFFPIRDDKRKELLGKISTIVLIVGLIMELPATRKHELQTDAMKLEAARTESKAESAKASAKGFESSIAGANERAAKAEAQVAKAGQQAADAEAKAGKANERAAVLEKEAALQREKAANAERALLELQRRAEDRHLTAAQRAAMAGILRSSPKGDVIVECSGIGLEPCALAAELVNVLEANGWKVAEFHKGVLGGSNPAGVIVLVYSQVPQRASGLLASLRAAGLTPQGQKLDGAPGDDRVFLVIGTKL